jgi:hypothetical protein
LLRLCPGRAALHEFFGTFSDVLADGDGEVVIAATAGEELRKPGHDEISFQNWV